jgi:hypothetical protein
MKRRDIKPTTNTFIKNTKNAKQKESNTLIMEEIGHALL